MSSADLKSWLALEMVSSECVKGVGLWIVYVKVVEEARAFKALEKRDIMYGKCDDVSAIAFMLLSMQSDNVTYDGGIIPTHRLPKSIIFRALFSFLF